MTRYSIPAPDGKTYQIEGPPGASDDQIRQEVLRQFPNAGKPATGLASPKAPPGMPKGGEGSPLEGAAARNPPDSVNSSPFAGVAETALNIGSGITALPVEAAASGYKLATAPWGQKAKQAAQASEAVRDAMVYQPKGAIGQGMTNVVGKVLGIPGEIGEAAEGAVQESLEGKGIPKTAMAAEITARMAPEVAATLLGAKLGSRFAGRGALAEATAAENTLKAARTNAPDVARQFVESKTGLKWDELPKELKDRLTTIARDPKTLEKVEPAVIEREARAEKINMPLSRADATRNVEDAARQELVTKVGGNNPLRNIRVAQNKALHGEIDRLRKDTGATATTREQGGRSVQDKGIRAKAAVSKENYDNLFAKARTTEPEAATSPKELFDLLRKKPDIQNLGFLQSWLKKADIEQEVAPKDEAEAWWGRRGGKGGKKTELRNVTLAELQDLREDASGISAHGQGSEKFYAKQVVKAIDRAFDRVPAAAKAWTEARDAFKAHQNEFERQGIIKALGQNKKGSSDPRVPIEKTIPKIISASTSKADILKLKKTLTKGGTAETRAAGEKAWKNVQAGVLDLLKKKASGKREIEGEAGEKQFNSSFLDMFNELEENGKIDAIFNKDQAAALRELAENVKTVRGKVDTGITNSHTAANLKVDNTLSGIEKISKLGKGKKGVFGKLLAGVLSKARDVYKTGEVTREQARAKTTPTMEAHEAVSKETNKAARKAARRRNTLRSLHRVEPVTHATTQLPAIQQDNDSP